MGWDISVSERIYHKLANELLFKIINGTIPMGSPSALWVWDCFSCF